MENHLAREYAYDALIWLTTHQTCLQHFLNLSGTTINDLRNRAKDPIFLEFILDFFMTSDELILTLSRDLNISPEIIKMARTVLSDNKCVNWT